MQHTAIAMCETYNFIDDVFVSSETSGLTDEEKTILEWTANDLPPGKICEILGVHERSFRRKQEIIHQKLNVNSPAAAVHRAHIMGVL
jgi:DNA-binding CsgD family transcriptional regulator